ncbi:MAG: pyridoxal phosphate-dependent aminotransferase [Acidobacteria bacterium]|nr:pyridoxal phosphate-dependent aminotransferase [Acidobacteriota bacterium]
MFSSRTPKELTTNKLTKIIEQKKLDNENLLDLTQSNPTSIDIIYPEKEILSALSNPKALIYQPDPKGLFNARKAIVDYYKLRKINIDIENIFLTASTSEAYTLLFKLLMEPGDSLLVPVPSYPLFEHLAQVEGVKTINYTLHYDGTWYIDFHLLQSLCKKNTRAIIIVNPNNPTGSFLKKNELAKLIEFCKDNQLALISDEVFCDYAHYADNERVSTIAEVSEILTFSLNGLSKAACLPQLKLGWILINGQGDNFYQAHNRLEFITDLFLSVSSPVQHALPELLKLAEGIQEQILKRALSNYSWLKSQIKPESVCSLLPIEAGWYAIIQIPKIVPEEELILELLIKDNLIIHPGYFFDLQMDGYLVVSLITKPNIFQVAINKLLSRIG